MPDAQDMLDNGKKVRLRVPRSARILRSEGFGRVIRLSATQLSFRREAVSVRTRITKQIGKVRIGLTVGKHHVPRAVDRVLSKRIMRECIRPALPLLQEQCLEKNLGLDVVFRICETFRRESARTGTADYKNRIRRATTACVDGLIKRMQSVCGQES